MSDCNCPCNWVNGSSFYVLRVCGDNQATTETTKPVADTADTALTMNITCRDRTDHVTSGVRIEVASESSESEVSDAAGYVHPMSDNQSSLHDIQWTMGPMRGWCFRVVQVGGRATIRVAWSVYASPVLD